jgi:DNA-binding NarL/FixJ family response regulator
MGPARDQPRARCLLVDDHLLVAQAIGGLLSEMCSLELQAVCTTVRQGIEQIEGRCPDLLILDLFLPGENWQDVASLFLQRNPHGRIVFLTGMSAEFVPPEPMEPAVLAVIDKGRAWQDLASVISAWMDTAPLLHGEGAQEDASAGPPADGTSTAPTPARLPLERLTPRELRVFLCLGRGLLNKEIAHELGLSLPTVETYRKNLAQKLGISGAELVRAAALHRCIRTVG